MSGPQPSSAEVVRIETEDEVDGLAAAIRDPGRTEPIVVLTSRQRERVPAFDVADVRELVGHAQRLIFVPDGPLTRQLADALPPKLAVFGGAARIWWPGVAEGSDPRQHPLVLDRYGVYGSQALQALRRGWEAGPPVAPARVEHPELVLLRDEVERLQAALTGRSDELREARERSARLEERLRLAQERSRQLGVDLGAPPHDDLARADVELDARGRFSVALVRAWATSLDAASREERPLRPWIVRSELPESIARLAPVSEERAAYVCAMVVCGMAPRVAGLQVHPLRAAESGGASQVTRASDGARAWRCALRTSTPSAPRLHWWERDDGVVELANAVLHDDAFVAGA